MRKNIGLAFRIALMFGDALAIVFAFGFAYFARTHLDSRPYFFIAEPLEFIIVILTLMPFWLIILAVFGLYRQNIFLNKSRLPEATRLLGASLAGTMLIITYDFFSQKNLFPVRVIALYAAGSCFISLMALRYILKLIRRSVLAVNHGVTKVIIVGNNYNTKLLTRQISQLPDLGYKLVGIVSNNSFVETEYRKLKFSSLKEALKKTRPDAIMQTDEKNVEYVYKETVRRHLAYFFVPSSAALSAHTGELEFVGNTPAILVKVTPLVGGARIVKRLSDIIFGLILIAVFLPIMGMIWILVKASEPKNPAIYVSARLSRYNRKVKVFKFRTMKTSFCGMTPEEAFAKLGEPELIKPYRKNGDFLDKDPRITKIGSFLRKTSLDELPQLLNVLRGDISLVGPRALVAGELKDYGDRSLLLSVKSGLTGLAQVSGRKNISFAERRTLDIYYVQNWTLGLDIKIIFKTILAVLTGKGAK